MSQSEDPQADKFDASADDEAGQAEAGSGESRSAVTPELEGGRDAWAESESQPLDDHHVEVQRPVPQLRKDGAVEHAHNEIPNVNPRQFDGEDRDLPFGMLRRGARGVVLVDAMAGRSSVFGYNDPRLREALVTAAQTACGDSAVWIDSAEDLERSPDRSLLDPVAQSLRNQVEQSFRDETGVSTELILLRPSADAAIDSAIGLVRRQQADKRFRTIALVGGDHGRTGMCRSASGCPELHEGFGPMMAGFSHVPAGDLGALQSAIDEQTACVLLAPLDFARGAAPCDSDYLIGVRELCDEHDLLLVIDETQVVLGASGSLLTFRGLAEIKADLVVLSAGLFNGLPGGLVLGSSRVAKGPQSEIGCFPVHASVLERTLAAMREHGYPQHLEAEAHPLAVSIAQVIRGFEFVRDLHATGSTIGIETDLDAEQVLEAASRNGLRIAPAGPNSVCLQPPLEIREVDHQQLLDRLGQTMEILERESAELSL
jgi:acetylornithine/succinyldiaminopimelate/putrescine aminotransferase